MTLRFPTLLVLVTTCNACGLLIDWPGLETLTDDGAQADMDGGTDLGGHAGACTDCPGDASGGSTLGGEGGGGSGGEVLEEDCELPCDCDNDHVLAGGACGGDDCDDHDPLVFPGQTAFFSERARHDFIGFDYDCSKKLDRDPAQNGEETIDCGPLGLANCAALPQAFAAPLPVCGAKGKWSACAKVPPIDACAAYVADDSVIARCH
ncbi:MAG TPA: hypothetical protein VLC09_05985 [Polyangiaceae bacterium]|nr:hypothetical protein [Polyangiaceae bacterium]